MEVTSAYIPPGALAAPVLRLEIDEQPFGIDSEWKNWQRSRNWAYVGAFATQEDLDAKFPPARADMGPDVGTVMLPAGFTQDRLILAYARELYYGPRDRDGRLPLFAPDDPYVTAERPPTDDWQAYDERERALRAKLGRPNGW